ncbi:MAG: helix-turn-helix transcriptional regulator [Bacilli bacterium]
MLINYAKKIKEYRERKFLTQSEFAHLIGVSIPCVTRWESGKFEPTIKVKKKLYQLFIDAGMKVEEE